MPTTPLVTVATGVARAGTRTSGALRASAPTAVAAGNPGGLSGPAFLAWYTFGAAVRWEAEPVPAGQLGVSRAGSGGGDSGSSCGNGCGGGGCGR